jgi:hypothetical protein
LIARELVYDAQQLDPPADGGGVELVVEGPHVIRSLGAKPICGSDRLVKALRLAALRRHSWALFTPQALDVLAVHPTPLRAQ